MQPGQLADNPEEILDLVDKNDHVVGTITRKEAYAEGNKNFRVVHGFIKNSDGKLWIPRRVATKKLYPLGLDFSIAGHVTSGETYEEAFIKEAQEEVGLDLSTIPYREIGHLNPYQDDISLFQKVYEIESDAVPEYDTHEFCEYKWLTPEEILERFQNGESMKSDIPKVVELCYL